MITRFATIDQNTLEVTKVEKVLPRLVKRGDDQGKKLAQKIIDNAAVVSKQKTVDENETKDARPIDGKKGEKGIATKNASGSDARHPSAKADAKAGTKTQPADASSTKGKANAANTKPSGFFSSLQSASKKPGTSSKLKDGKPR